MRTTKTRSFVSVKTGFTNLTNSADLDFGTLHPPLLSPLCAVFWNKSFFSGYILIHINEGDYTGDQVPLVLKFHNDFYMLAFFMIKNYIVHL